jgi:HlyD family secretion protein
MDKRTASLLACLVLAACPGRGNGGGDGGSAPEGPVLSREGVVAEAAVVPVRFTTLSMPTGGLVQKVLVAEGDVVGLGQPLVKLDTREVEARLRSARAELQRAQASLRQVTAAPRPEELAIKEAALAQTRSEEAHADTELQRLRELRARQVLADADVERAEAAFRRAEATRQLSEADMGLMRAGPRAEAVGVANAGVAAAQAVVQQVEALLVQMELKAPMAGTVVYLEARPGEFLPPGAPVARVADTSQYVLRTEDLTELAVVHVHQGARAKITLDAIPGLEIPGRVAAIRGFGERKKGDMTYTVTVEPETQDPRLRWNMTASVRILPAADGGLD